jgi:hypothetical protein
VLAHPAIITIAGILYFVEFLADKVPWIDSAWDSVHTVIRPIGGALLGVQVLGTSNPTFDVIVMLLAGGTSLVAHTSKASTRLVANTSPEPFSNIALSLVEDVAVFGGLALIAYNPIVALCVFAALLGLAIYFVPKMLRAMKAKLWLVFRKLKAPADTGVSATLPTTVPANLADIFSRHNVLTETIAWAVPCISGRGHRIPANLFGALVATNEEPRKLTFVARKRGRAISETIDLDGCTVIREPKFLSENLVILPIGEKGPKYLFIFPRSSGGAVEEIIEYLRPRLAPAPLTSPVAEPEPALHAGRAGLLRQRRSLPRTPGAQPCQGTRALRHAPQPERA